MVSCDVHPALQRSVHVTTCCVPTALGDTGTTTDELNRKWQQKLEKVVKIILNERIMFTTLPDLE